MATLLTMLKAKIHRARVTEANPDYEGSITIDQNLLEASGILPYEQVHVVDVDNGARLVTYAIPGEPGSGTIGMNGAAARLIRPTDVVIIIAYAQIDAADAKGWSPKIVHVDANNRPL